MNKKIYIIDRNGRMHVIELVPSLTINGVLITTADQAECELINCYSNGGNIIFKTDTYLKIFDSKKLLGVQVVPENE